MSRGAQRRPGPVRAGRGHHGQWAVRRRRRPDIHGRKDGRPPRVGGAAAFRPAAGCVARRAGRTPGSRHTGVTGRGRVLGPAHPCKRQVGPGRAGRRAAGAADTARSGPPGRRTRPCTRRPATTTQTSSATSAVAAPHRQPFHAGPATRPLPPPHVHLAGPAGLACADTRWTLPPADSQRLVNVEPHLPTARPARTGHPGADRPDDMAPLSRWR